MIPYNVPLGIIYKVITHVRGVTAEQKAVENHDWAAGRRGVAGRGPPFKQNPGTPLTESTHIHSYETNLWGRDNGKVKHENLVFNKLTGSKSPVTERVD